MPESTQHEPQRRCRSARAVRNIKPPIPSRRASSLTPVCYVLFSKQKVDDETKQWHPAFASRKKASTGSTSAYVADELLSESSAPSSARRQDATQEHSPPPSTPPVRSIDEPLLSLDEIEAEAHSPDAMIASLRAELAEVRFANKAAHAEVDAVEQLNRAEGRRREEIHADNIRLEQENSELRLQLADHHGIMAADWAQTLNFQERLRQEEGAKARLAAEVVDLQHEVSERNEEAASLRQDASHWRVLCCSESLAEVKSSELENVLEAALPAALRIHAEMLGRCKTVQQQLSNELEHRLCVVCRDREKSVLFAPCHHVCVCETCRGRLRPYRCPMCQEPVQMHIARVHF